MKKTTEEHQRARKARNSRDYRRRHQERARESRRKTDAKRRKSEEWKRAQKLKPKKPAKPRPKKTAQNKLLRINPAGLVLVEAGKRLEHKRNATLARAAFETTLDKATGWARWTAEIGY